MGEISEMIQDGILCDECGGFVGDEKIRANGGKVDGDNILEVPGRPLTCNDCKREARKQKYGKRKEQHAQR